MPRTAYPVEALRFFVPVKIKILREGVVEPRYAHEGDAGFDLIAPDNHFIPCGTTKMVPLGYALEIPNGYEVQIRPRSGWTLQWGSYVANSPGTVDSSYRGEVCVLVQAERCSIQIRKGDKIAQGVLNEVPRAQFILSQELEATERNGSGFGSTGS